MSRHCKPRTWDQLVVNAIDAMADTPSDDRAISIRTSRVENFAELAISDRGLGIPED
jgi:C4-dicarboxylate-specific signal transduction histidine kinase